MLSYALLSITFLLAILGSFFEKVEKDVDGKIRRGYFGIPVLTGAGYSLVLLLSASYVASVAQARRVAHDSETANKNLSEQLNQTRNQLASLTTLDIEQFTQVSRGFKQTVSDVNRKLEASSNALVQTMQNTTDNLNRNIVGSMNPLDGFDLTVFFSHSLSTSRVMKKGEYAYNSGNLALLSDIACEAPVNMTIYLDMALADAPDLNLSARVERISEDDCTHEVRIGVFGAASTTDLHNRNIRPGINKRGVVFDKFTLDSAVMHDLSAAYKLSAAMFKPLHGGASIRIHARDKQDLKIAADYVQKRLPFAIGFHEVPLANEGLLALKNLATGQAYVLDGRVDHLEDEDSKDLNFVLFVYTRAPMHPEWMSMWDSYPGIQPDTVVQPDREIKIWNPYRALKPN